VAEPAHEIPAGVSAESEAPVRSTFPEDEPIFAAAQAATEPLHEEHEDISPSVEEPVESASTTIAWNQEFRHSEATAPAPAWERESIAAVSTAPEHAAAPEPASEVIGSQPTHEESSHDIERLESDGRMVTVSEHSVPAVPFREDQVPAFAAPGTMEEETIDEDEAEAVHFHAATDDSYDEFEEETQNAGQPYRLDGEARAAVTEIHMASLAESGEIPAVETASPESEDDSEELELEEAQAQAEALLDAEARGNGAVDARVEVRAPSTTAGYTQRTQRPR
jgi:hypothetical protein